MCANLEAYINRIVLVYRFIFLRIVPITLHIPIRRQASEKPKYIQYYLLLNRIA